MRSECIDAVEAALGRSLRKGEVAKIDDAVGLHMRLLARQDPAAWRALSQPERLDAAANAAIDAMKEEAAWKQRNVELQILAHDRISNTLNDAFENLDNQKRSLLNRITFGKMGRSEGENAGDRMRVVSQLLAFDTKARGMQSADSWGHAVRAEAMGELLPLWQSVKGNFFGLFENPEGVRDVIKEMYGEDSGNATAKAGVEAWRKVTDGLRDRANAAGQRIGELENDAWHYPQSHSQNAVAQAGLDKWAGDILPLLDRDMYINPDGTRMTDQQMLESVLPSAFDSIVTDGVNKVEPGAFGYGVAANRGAGHRALFFKDSDSFINYQGQYGDRNLWNSLTGHISRLSRDIGLMETLGPNPRATFDYFNDRTRLDELRQTENGWQKAKVEVHYHFNKNLFDYVSGQQKIVDQRIADGFQTFRNWQVATKLGQVVITALGDEAGMAATAFANKVPWTDSMMRELTYMNPANAEDRAAAMHAGLGINSIIGGLNRFGSEDFGGGGDTLLGRTNEGSAKLANSVMTLSGAEKMWDVRRQALGSVLMSYIGKTTQEVPNFADINEVDHGMLATKGITDTDWQVWRAAEPEDWGAGAKTVLTPKAVWNIPDEDIAHLGDPTALKRHASTMLLSHVLEETGMGVMDQGARERTKVTLGTSKGSVGGELTRSMMLFKGFSASMMMKHWGRMSSLQDAPMGWNNPTFKYGLTLGVVGTIAAATANQLRSFASGKNPENMADPRFWGSSVLRGGGLGFYGDFLYSEMTAHDTSLIPALMGPLATEVEGVWNLTGAAAFKHARGERVDEAANTLRFARSEIPFLNMWYTKAAADHLIWNNLQEAANPGYLDRMMTRSYADKGTTYYWDPHGGMPQVPDIKQAWNPELGQQKMAAMLEKAGIE